MRNLITDVPGILVGHAHDEALRSGVTVLLADAPLTCAVDVRGGGPGTRETDLLSPDTTVERIDAIALSGGSAFGLGAADGVQHWLRDQGRGFQVGGVPVPIVPAAIIFDLLNGGNKDWTQSPYPGLGAEAAASAAAGFALGSAGAGYGASTATLKGGIGSASQALGNGLVVGALAVVNAVGSATIGDTRHFWAAPFEQDGEFGGHGLPAVLPGDAATPRTKGAARQSTTLAVIATNARLSKAELRRVAIMAQDGLARALYPVHTPLDGDVVFAVSHGDTPIDDPVFGMSELGIAATNTLSRAVARGVYEAAQVYDSGPPAYRDRLNQDMNWRMA